MTQFKLCTVRVVYCLISVVLSSVSSVEGASQCDVFGTCSQTCTDTGNGSYQCSCMEGFLLGQDHKSCNPIDPQWKLIYATKYSVGCILKLSNGTEVRTKLMDNIGRYVVVTYDVRSNLMYWTGQKQDSPIIYRKSLNSQAGDGEQIETIADAGIYKPSGIAFDWITGNIYLVDNDRSHIVVCRSATGDCAVVIQRRETEDRPDTVALHPNQRIMFWTDWGSTPSISRAGMDGALDQIIVSTGVVAPNGITIDQGSARIFWADSSPGRIDSSRFDGSDRRIVASSIRPEAISMFGDRIFWGDWLSDKILSADKYNGSDRQVHISLSEYFCDLDLLHITNQPISISNPCLEAHNCSHICALSQAESKFRCFCPIGMMLQDDNITCVEQRDVPKLAIAFRGTIKLMKFNTIGKTRLESITFPNINSISAIVYNPINHTLIFSDAATKRIYEYRISTGEVNILIDKHLDVVNGMDIDVVGENLYWIDSGKQTVEVMAFPTGARSVIKTGVEQAADILIVPKMGLLFLARTGEGGGSIDKMFLNGDGMSSFKTFNDKQPIALSYDKASSNILWVDRMSQSVQTISIDGNSLSTFAAGQRVIPSDVAIFESQVLWPDAFTKQIKFKSVDSNNIYSIAMDKFEGNSSHFGNETNFQAKLAVINNNLLDLKELLSGHECSRVHPSKKTCSHMCLLTGEELVGVCRCPEGFTLDENGVTCKQKLACDRNQFSCKDGQCISGNSVCNGISDCTLGEDETQCHADANVPPCPGEGFMCPTDGFCIPKSFVCDQDEDCVGGADELNCHFDSCQPDLEFKCKRNGGCISSARRCNEVVDCPDQSDELNCNKTCPPGFFKCVTLYECIDDNWVCDGGKDCDDGSDEMDCGPSVGICSPQQFTCNSGRCIDSDLKCDGLSNCPDNEDEVNCESFHQPTTQNEDNDTTSKKYAKAEHDGNWNTYVIVIGLITVFIVGIVVIIALVLSKMKRGEATLEQIQFDL